MKKRVILGVVAAGALLLLGVVYRSTTGEPVKPELARRGVAPAELVPKKRMPLAARLRGASLDTPGAPLAALLDGKGEGTDETPSSEDWEDNPLGDIIRDIVDEDKDLGTFLYYYEHVLLDAESRKQYEKLLSDKTLYADTKQDLLYPGETKETLRGNVKRFIKIDYLHAALEWKANPSMDALLDTIESIILEDNLPEGTTTDMKLSLAGNKMELFALLYDKAPERAAGVVVKAKGTRLEALIAFIAESIAQRREKEKNLDGEVRL